MSVEVPLTDAEDESRKVGVGLGKLVTVDVRDEEVDREEDLVAVGDFVGETVVLVDNVMEGVNVTESDVVHVSDRSAVCDEVEVIEAEAL